MNEPNEAAAAVDGIRDGMKAVIEDASEIQPTHVLVPVQLFQSVTTLMQREPLPYEKTAPLLSQLAHCGATAIDPSR